MSRLSRVTYIAALLAISSGVPVPDVAIDSNACGYRGCPAYDPNVLNVHIVAHTHDDVGWLKTVDQYYYGSKNQIQTAGVQYILDSVIKELWADPKRRFIYVETAFFWKWWVRQTQDVKDQVHQLVDQGRLQFVGGAWSMNDEAAAHYHSTIDQFTWGLRKLNETFGECALPRVGWQIDPFGHSREFASLLAGMGYHGLFLGRIDYQDKENRKAKKTMEMIWRGSDDLGNASDIFTGVLYNTYSPPSGFCFDILCSDEPIIDDPNSPMYNVETKIRKFIEYVKSQAKNYRTNNVLVTMGGDFNYQDAVTWFTNLDRLIKYTNLKAAKDGLNIKLMYSTPNCYLKSVNEAKPTLPVKQDDFFPYASDPNSYWTGYFTSRPTTKYFERRTNVYLQMLKQLQALTGLPEHNMFVLNELKSAMGIMQHHDAITGTEKQHVTHDYERILTLALDDALIIARQGLNKVMYAGDGGSNETLHFDRCHLNESRCDTTEGSKRFIVTLYNTEPWVVKSSPVRIPVTSPTYAVIAPNGEEIVSQIVEIPEHIRKLNAKKSKATHEIVFLAYNVKGLGYKSFYVQEKGSNYIRSRREASDKISKNRQNDENFDINNYWKKINIYDNFNYSPNKIHFIDDEPLIVNLEEEIPVGQAILEKPLHLNHEKNKIVDGTDLNLESDIDILRDGATEDAKRPVKEEVRARANDDERRTGDGKMSYPKLKDDELRMLADEPQTVEMYSDDEFLESENIKLRINNTTGQITNVILPDGTERSFTITTLYYPGCHGNNEIPQNRSSGAYIFRPDATKPILIELKKENLVKGPVVQEVRFTSEFVSLTARIYDKADYIEVDWTVGPIPISDNVGKEVIIKYNTDIVNNGEFYTDSNGRQVLKRKLNERPQWNLTVTEPIAGNYYPVTNEIHIKDNSLKLTVYTDRSEGGGSLEEGSIETMVHRRLLHDDAFGVGEALNETVDGIGLVARGTQRIYFATNDQLTNLDNEPIVLVSEAKNLSLDEWLPLRNCESLLKRYPATGIRILTIEPWSENSLLVRFENVNKKNSNENAIEVNLSKIFDLKLKTVKETTLSGNMWAENQTKMDWNVEGDFVEDFNESYGASKQINTSKPYLDRLENTEFVIHLRPKEIRTFVVVYDL